MSFEHPSEYFEKSPLAGVSKGGFSAGRMEKMNDQLLGALDLSTDKKTGLMLALYNHRKSLPDAESRAAFVRSWVADNVQA